jgi:REP element-mobilizing transposase RayT
MSSRYKAYNNDKAYFITITTVGWIDLFTRQSHKKTIIDSLKYCQKEKGLEIYAYVIMPSHLHLICRAVEPFIFSDIMRDFKKFTPNNIEFLKSDNPAGGGAKKGSEHYNAHHKKP